MARTLLIRGMLVGLLAGLVAFGVARLFGEGPVAEAIGVESAKAAAAGDAGEPEMVSRAVQSTVGLLTATVVYGIGLGGIFGLVFGFAQGRVLRVGARALAAVIATTGFVVLYAVPFVKYPPNPPAVGNPDTIGERTGLYFAMVAISILLAALAYTLGRRIEPRAGRWNAAIAAGAVYVVAVGLAEWAMPTSQEVGPDFPAVTLYEFRLASFGIQLALWTTLGLAFGALTERAMRAPAGTRPPATVPAG